MNAKKDDKGLVKKIRVRLKGRSYDIAVGANIVRDKSGAFLKRLNIGRDAVVITNSRLLKIYGMALKGSLASAGFTVRFELVPDSEAAKSNKVAAMLINRISSYDTHKDLFIVAFGGGVVGDLAGFVAAVYKRGIPYVQIPTTLLAQVDSAIGGKVAIDLSVAKNLVGAFYQPRLVLSDVSLLKTLSPRQVRNGLAEIIKYGVIKDRALFEFLEKNYRKVLRLERKTLEYVVMRSSRIKASLVSKDEFDKRSLRAVLNFGHTIGHAIETACGYSNRFYHGEAVACGMVIAARISAALGKMKASDADRVEALINAIGLPTRMKGLNVPDIYRSHLHDKKFIHGKNRFVLPTGIGSVKVVSGVPDPIIIRILKKHLC